MRFLLAGAPCLLLTACAQPAPPQFTRAADAGARTPAIAAPVTTADARDFRIVGPGDWATINRRVTPELKGERR